jgi:flagellar protein FlgJ
MPDSPGLNALQGPNTTLFAARMEAAQMERLQAKLQATAGSVEKASAKAAGKMEPGEAAKLQKVSKDFESIFLAYLMKTMRQAVPKSDFMGQSQAEQIFGEMRDEELSKGMAEAGGIGLSRLLVEQLKKSLEAKNV